MSKDRSEGFRTTLGITLSELPPIASIHDVRGRFRPRPANAELPHADLLDTVGVDLIIGVQKRLASQSALLNLRLPLRNDQPTVQRLQRSHLVNELFWGSG